MRRGRGAGRVGAAVTALLASLSLVTWRQTRALEELADLDRVRREIEQVRAERNDVERRIQALESRTRVVPQARARLGMHTPSAREIVILPGELP